ncbi:MAG: hypothetical protein Q8N00_10725 [Nitrospirota bacterium]|nr:hypothetical protein [Nitrospirota bacterium]MDP3598924.1 hypothetical protein [Nitrospirota bacterium]
MDKWRIVLNCLACISVLFIFGVSAQLAPLWARDDYGARAREESSRLARDNASRQEDRARESARQAAQQEASRRARNDAARQFDRKQETPKVDFNRILNPRENTSRRDAIRSGDRVNQQRTEASRVEAIHSADRVNQQRTEASRIEANRAADRVTQQRLNANVTLDRVTQQQLEVNRAETNRAVALAVQRFLQATGAAPTGLGETMIKEGQRSGLNVDLAAQQHKEKTAFRLGSGKNVESAHMVNSSSVSELSNYVRDHALTVLLPRAQHRAFDDYWKKWARARIKKAHPGEDVTITVAEWELVLIDAADSVPALKGRTAGAMSFMIRTELYQTLGLEPNQRIRLPYAE